MDLGAIVFALNGWHDHVHLVASVPARLAVAKFIGQVKAVGTARFNKSGHPQIPIFERTEDHPYQDIRENLAEYQITIDIGDSWTPE